MADGHLLELEEVMVCHVEGGIIGMFAEGPTNETSQCIRFHSPDGTKVWPWGVINALGGDGPVRVYGSPSRPRDIIVIPS